jgi:hypothetical protein
MVYIIKVQNPRYTRGPKPSDVGESIPFTKKPSSLKEDGITNSWWASYLKNVLRSNIGFKLYIKIQR